MNSENLTDPVEQIEALIWTVRGQPVILDTDLARVFGMYTFRFNEITKRNRDQFPTGSRFQLTRQEYADLLGRTVLAHSGRGGRRTPPYVFTERGVIVAAKVLNSPEAGQASKYLVRAFVRRRELLGGKL